jgi:hypothetical protein
MIETARKRKTTSGRGEAAALRTALARYQVAEPTDGTGFRRKARLMASLWREANGLTAGSHRVHRQDGTTVSRVLGSRLELDQAKATGANFLTPTILQQVTDRLARPEAHELIQQERLWADLLSSQPMCFNLFGELAADLELATSAAQAWWPNRVEQVTELRFEWSPGRRDRRYLDNRTAFDAVFMHTTPDGRRGFIGVETRYHERAARPERLRPTGSHGTRRSPSAPARFLWVGGRRWHRRACSRSGLTTCWPYRCCTNGTPGCLCWSTRPPTPPSRALPTATPPRCATPRPSSTHPRGDGRTAAGGNQR